MSPFARQTALWVVAAALVAALVAFALRDRPGTMAVALPFDLTGKFNFVAFTGHGDNASRMAWKRTDPMLLLILGEAGEPQRRRVERILDELARLTGLPHRTTADADRSTARIHFVPSDDFWSVFRSMAIERNIGKEDLSSLRCYMLPGGGDGLIDFAMIAIDITEGNESINACMLQQIVLSLGMFPHSEEIRPSIFSINKPVEELTLNDRILIRAFYDPAIVPGMKKEEVMRIVPGIIEKLVKRVKTDGEAALVHPHYVFR